MQRRAPAGGGAVRGERVSGIDRSWALLLDRINTEIVRWRLRGVAEGGVGAAPSPGSGPFLRVARRRRGQEVWRRGSGSWLATRCRPQGEPRAAVLFLHGWLATTLHLRLMRRALEPLRREGVEVWLPRLPGHVERTPPGVASGTVCLSPEPAASAAMVRAGVTEAVELGEWLAARGLPVGVWGISLGGWVAALAASASDCWAGVVLWAPVVDPVATWRSAPLVAPLRRAAGAGGVDVRAAEGELAALAPIRLQPRVPPPAVRVFAGLYDDVVAAADVRRFAARWGVRVSWYEAGHISMLLSRRARAECRAFLSRRLLEAPAPGPADAAGD